jgi:hypothetical protein
VQQRHDWTVAGVAFVASMLVNGMLLAYSYGKLEQRVTALEKERAEQQAEWQAARNRIERTVEKLEEAISKRRNQ